ncbi:MAG: carboxypeptidase-like regulatory domain-containing protein, partial [Bacteroidota bacterium]
MKYNSPLAIAALLAALCIIPATLSAQTGELHGKVTGLDNGEPILRASIRVVGTKLGAFSDQSGRFAVRNIPLGAYTIRVTYVGYAPEEITGVTIDGKE